MTTRVEFGNLNRGDNTPIFIKEKIGADGAPSIRIYQRKDVNSIENLTDRIKTKIKYGVENFFIDHEKFQPLLKKIGFSKVNQIKTDDVENPRDLLQAIKFGSRIGSVEKEDEQKLKEILEKHEFNGDYNYTFYKGGYKTQEFLSDLTKFAELGGKQSINDHNLIYLITIATAGSHIMTSAQLEKCTEKIDQIRKGINQHFDDEIERLAARPGSKNTETSINDSPGEISDFFEDLRSEINGKLDEIKTKITQRSITPANEDIKKYLLETLNQTLAIRNQEQSTGDETRAAIDVLYSTSWWISDERRVESLKKVRDFFIDLKERVPEVIQQEIFRRVEAVENADSEFSTISRQRMSNPYSGVNYDSE